MGDWRSEDGHDAVAEHLIHRPFKAMDGLHHDVNGRIEELLGRFRIEVLISSVESLMSE